MASVSASVSTYSALVTTLAKYNVREISHAITPIPHSCQEQESVTEAECEQVTGQVWCDIARYRLVVEHGNDEQARACRHLSPVRLSGECRASKHGTVETGKKSPASLYCVHVR